MLRLWLALTVAIVLVAASTTIVSMRRTPPGPEPTAVISGYETARNQQDMETALSYFADDAIVTQRNTTFTGKDQIRKYLDSISARAPYTVVSDRHSSGNIVSWTERTTPQQQQPAVPPPTTRLPGYTGGQTSPGASFSGRPGTSQGASTNVTTQQANFVVTVEAVVQDGKIQSMSYIFGGQALRPDPALEGRAQLPAGVGLAAVLAVLLGVILVASTGAGRAPRASSRLQGHLMQDLRGWAAARE